MAADAPKVDAMTTPAPIAAAERIFLSISSCLHRPFAPRANNFPGPSVPKRYENSHEVWANDGRHGRSQPSRTNLNVRTHAVEGVHSFADERETLFLLRGGAAETMVLLLPGGEANCFSGRGW